MVIVNGNGTESDAFGLSEEEQRNLAWNGASKCATARTQYVERTVKGNINYAIGFLQVNAGQPRFFLAKSTTLSYMNREEESQQAYMHYQRLVLMRKSA